MAKRGLPTTLSMRHDSHYVEELVRSNRTIGKILPIDKIEPNPNQPRVEIGDLTDLTSSIKEKGVLEPLLVKPNKSNGTWMIIAGERRWRASNLAGLLEVPCIELDIDENSIAEIALIENLQRKDLTIWEEADGLASLAAKYNYTHEQIAKKIGKSRTTITETMTIAGIPDEIRLKCLDNKISAKSTLLEIARQFDDQAMFEYLERIVIPQKNQNTPHKLNKPKAKNPKQSINLQNSKTESTYNFTSFDNSFDLQIKFQKDSYEKKDILRALKEAFETIKSEKE